MLSYYTDETRQRSIKVFAPFLEKYNYSFPEEWGDVKVSLMSKIEFKVLRLLRRINQKYLKKPPDIIELEGTIYGDIQRKRSN